MDEEHLLLIIISFPLSIGRLCLHHTCFLSLFLLLPLFFFFFFLFFFFFFFFFGIIQMVSNDLEKSTGLATATWIDHSG